MSFTPAQAAFVSSMEPFPAFVGGFGSGKTAAALAIAQAMQGQMQEAATTLTGLKRLVPGYTLSAFRENTGFKISALGDQFARALQHAGLDG